VVAWPLAGSLANYRKVSHPETLPCVILNTYQNLPVLRRNTECTRQGVETVKPAIRNVDVIVGTEDVLR